MNVCCDDNIKVNLVFLIKDLFFSVEIVLCIDKFVEEEVFCVFDVVNGFLKFYKIFVSGLFFIFFEEMYLCDDLFRKEVGLVFSLGEMLDVDRLVSYLLLFLNLFLKRLFSSRFIGERMENNFFVMFFSYYFLCEGDVLDIEVDIEEF